MVRRNSTREPASIVRDNELGDLSYPAGRHRKLRWPQLTHERLGKGFAQTEGEWNAKVELSSKKKSPAVREACMAIF